MAQIKVHVYQPATDKAVDVQLPDDAPVSRLVRALAKELKIQEQSGGTTEYRLSYKGPNPPDPFDFKDDDTLAGKGVKEGSKLAFTHKFIAG